jgi:precorrin-6B methylase 2
MPMNDPELVTRASRFHPWDAMAPAALSGILDRGPFRLTAETGCGGSTIVFSHASEHHVAFAIQGENRTISKLREQDDFRADTVNFIEGESKHTLPEYRFEEELDLMLLDGPHAYPLPQIEFAYLFPHLKVGGSLVIDDIQIPSVHELFTFLKIEPSVALEEVRVRTAFFRRINAVETGPDGWMLQGINRHTVWRYSWRDKLRKLLRR